MKIRIWFSNGTEFNEEILKLSYYPKVDQLEILRKDRSVTTFMLSTIINMRVWI